jgi:short-subunit dehydrogenase
MPKKINQQVVVVTGASSGIGRVTARMFAERGASVVVGARNVEALGDLAQEIKQAGGHAIAVPTDVSERHQVDHLAQAAVDHFGRIDTWVNNAGVSLYATFDKLTDAEIRRVMDVNFMGTVYGMQAALSIMQAAGGGTIINISSVAGKRAIPLQSVYSASKYAIVGLGEAVRTELAAQGLEINVCTICPPSINTPFFDHARTKEGRAPKPLPPVYEPEAVAEAILSCAENPQREVLIGAAGKAFAVLNIVAPGLSDWYLGKTGVEGQLLDEPKSADVPDNLFRVPAETRERSGWTFTGEKASASASRQPALIKRHPLALCAAAFVAATLASGFLFGPGEA